MTWWRDAVFYQIYPRSFLDTNGDGVGDLAGILSKLAYLESLGIDALWITPIYPSPMKDFGYDVADYCDVSPVYGDLDEFDHLVTNIHARGMKVVLDWVPNHTSSEHPWFLDARSSRESVHRDWYVWRDATESGNLPNNWLRSWSDEPAWTLDDASNQYYLHCFLPEQPDLNWATVAVRDAMADTLRFWLRRGVDGFRMDVIHLIGKDPALPDDPEELVGIGHVPLNDRPESHLYLREIRAVLDEFDGERTSVGEVYLLDPERVADYYGHGDELHLSFNFASLVTPWRADAWRDLVARTEASHRAVDGWPTWVLSNHDNKRVASRLRGDRQRVRSAMTLLLTLRGTPFLYAGEELGMLDAEIPPELVVDPGLRDGCRSPIPWTREYPHGWAQDPWLPFAADSDALSVENQAADQASMLHFVTNLLALRHRRRSLTEGSIDLIHSEDDVLMYRREFEGEITQVYVNFSRDARWMTVPPASEVLFSGTGDARVADGELALAPSEAVLLTVSERAAVL